MNQPAQPYNPGAGTPRFFPHLAGVLILASAGLMGFLGKWEEGAKPILTVYPDKVAGNLPTVCKGLTRHVTSTPIIVGEVWTVAKCEAEEAAAVTKVQLQLAKCFKKLPPQIVFDMATSHAWNNGAPATCKSGAMQKFNEGEWAHGCRRLAYSDSGKRIWSYVKDGKNADGSWRYKFVEGLANRRGDEYRTCLQGVPR